MKTIRCSVKMFPGEISVEKLAEVFEKAVELAGFGPESLERTVSVLQDGPAGVIYGMRSLNDPELFSYCLVHGDASDPVFFSGKLYKNIYIATVRNKAGEEAQNVYEESLVTFSSGILDMCKLLASTMTKLLS